MIVKLKSSANVLDIAGEIDNNVAINSVQETSVKSR